MRAIAASVANYFREAWEAWNKFWFAPADPATLSLIRLLAGGVAYSRVHTGVHYPGDVVVIGGKGTACKEARRSSRSYSRRLVAVLYRIMATPSWACGAHPELVIGWGASALGQPRSAACQKLPA